MPTRKYTEPPPVMLSVYDGRTCCGFCIRRGENRYEAFNHRGKSLGIFESQQQATAAIPRRPEVRS
jgi:hypothetical protein